MQRLSDVLNHIKGYMDEFVVGHDDVKEAILLALTSKEHLYIEGPPGTAKTMLAEIASKAAGMEFFFYQLHRDTRLPELIGDYVIQRERDGNSELIRQNVEKGKILTSDICVLDDISRAPGEALNVLLRVLNERKFGRDKIPLLTTIATSNPMRDEYYNEPLDLANLDRFTLQLKTVGLMQMNQWDQAEAVIDYYSEKSFDEDGIRPIASNALRNEDFLLEVAFPKVVKSAFLEILYRLINEHNLNEENSLITDRTFLVKAVKIIRAKAVLEGRTEANLSDLRVLKYLTTFRVPPDVHNQLEELIEDTIKKKSELDDGETSDELVMTLMEQELPGLETTASSEEEPAKDEYYNKEVPLEDADVRRGPPENDPFLQNKEMVRNLDPVLKVVQGEIEKSIATKDEAYGGVPKQWREMHSLDEFFDADMLETAVWVEDTPPRAPKVFRRTKKEKGGRVAVIRDISQSMTGRASLWVSMAVLGLIEMARKNRMHIGYVEFNHQSFKYTHKDIFFSTNYERLKDRSMDCQCSGFTDYQNALQDALAEFKQGSAERQHIVFLTDGMPTSGDREVREEIRLAKKIGVAIHSIFVGKDECPPVLRKISKETRGVHFQVMPDKDGEVKVFELSR